METSSLFGLIIASALASSVVLAEGTAATPAAGTDKKDAGYCQNSCKGKSACAGHGNASCAGKNACKGKGSTKDADAKSCKKAHGTWQKG